MYLFYKNNMKTSPKIMNINVYIMLVVHAIEYYFYKKRFDQNQNKGREQRRQTIVHWESSRIVTN